MLSRERKRGVKVSRRIEKGSELWGGSFGWIEIPKSGFKEKLWFIAVRQERWEGEKSQKLGAPDTDSVGDTTAIFGPSGPKLPTT